MDERDKLSDRFLISYVILIDKKSSKVFKIGTVKTTLN